MRNIKLTNGSIYPVDKCGAADGTLQINIISMDTLPALVNVFCEPNNVSIIEHYFDGTATDHIFYYGYTHLSGIWISSTGTTITLKQEM